MKYTQLEFNFKLEKSIGPRIFRAWYPTPYSPGESYLYIRDINKFSHSIEGHLYMWGHSGATLIARIENNLK